MRDVSELLALRDGTTEGPWEWSDRYPTQGGEETFSLLGEGGGFGVLSCDGLGNSPQHVRKANAAAIAAVPELFAAVEAQAREIAALTARLHKMHRRAQKAEGLSQRSAALLETIMFSIKEVIPLLPTLPSPYPLSLHTLFHRVRAARDHARASSGRAFIEGYYYYGRKLKAAEAEIAALTARAEAAEAKVARLVEAVKEARDEAHSVAHSEFDGVWSQEDFDGLTPLADAALADIGGGNG